MWNRMNLIAPPINTARVRFNKHDALKIRTEMRKLVNFLDDGSMNVEINILQKLTTKLKHRYRLDKGFKYMQMLTKTTQRFLTFETHHFKQFTDMLTIDGGVSDMPTRQMVQHVLVRLQGLAKLLTSTMDVAALAGKFWLYRIHLMQSWPLAVFVAGVLARIWTISNALVLCCCDCYDILFSFYHLFESNGLVWLSDNHMFPSTLKEWVGVSAVDWRLDEQDTIERIFSLLDCSDEELEKKVETTDEKLIEEEHAVEVNDFGEMISREMFDKSLVALERDVKIKNNKSNKKKTEKRKEIQKTMVKLQANCHDICNITSPEALEKFMRKEKKFRNTNNDKSLTKRLDLMQFKLLNQTLNGYLSKLKKCESTKQSRKYLRKVQGILQENLT